MAKITADACQSFSESEGYKRTGTGSKAEMQTYADYINEKVWKDIDSFELLSWEGLGYGM